MRRVGKGVDERGGQKGEPKSKLKIVLVDKRERLEPAELQVLVGEVENSTPLLRFGGIINVNT